MSKHQLRRRSAIGLGAALVLQSSIIIPAAAQSESPDAAPAGWKVALLSQGPNNDWAAQFDAVARARVASYGDQISELLYFDSQGNADKQVKDMEDAMAQDPDAIVLVPMGAAALAGPVERAEEAGVPVVLCATNVETDAYTSSVGRELEQLYGQTAEWLVDRVGSGGNVILIDGIAGVGTSEIGGKAVRDVLAQHPDITVVGEGYSDWSIATAKQLVETIIASGVQIDGAYANGGEPAIGIVQAFVDAGKPVPPIAGTNAQNGSLRVLAENDVPFMGVQFPPAMSAGCIDVAVDILEGQEVQKSYEVSELLPGMENITEADLAEYYRPEYTDGYQPPTDQYITPEELAALRLVR